MFHCSDTTQKQGLFVLATAQLCLPALSARACVCVCVCACGCVCVLHVAPHTHRLVRQLLQLLDVRGDEGVKVPQDVLHGESGEQEAERLHQPHALTRLQEEDEGYIFIINIIIIIITARRIMRVHLVFIQRRWLDKNTPEGGGFVISLPSALF